MHPGVITAVQKVEMSRMGAKRVELTRPRSAESPVSCMTHSLTIMQIVSCQMESWEGDDWIIIMDLLSGEG